MCREFPEYSKSKNNVARQIFSKKRKKLRQRFVLESAAILLATLVTNLPTVKLHGPARASHFTFTVSSLENA